MKATSPAIDPSTADGGFRPSTLGLPALALALAVFAGAASMRCLDALLPALAHDFQRSVGSVGAAASVYAFSYSLCQLVHGPLGDRLGTYLVVTVATVLSAAAAGACAFAPSLSALIALRLLAGAVAAAIGPLTLAWISEHAPSDQRPVALARMTAAAILGAAFGQSGGGMIGGLFGWNAIFAGLALLFCLSAFCLVAVGRQRGLLSIMPAPRMRDDPRRPSILATVRRRTVLHVLGFVATQGFGLYFSLTYVGAMLSQRLSTGSERSGLILSCFGLGGVAFVVVAPRILGRWETHQRATAGGVVLALGFAALALSSESAIAAAALFAVGFGFLMLHNVLQIMAARMAPDALATSLSLFAAASSLSQALGATAGGYGFDRLGPACMCLISAAVLMMLGRVVAKAARGPMRRT